MTAGGEWKTIGMSIDGAKGRDGWAVGTTAAEGEKASKQPSLIYMYTTVQLYSGLHAKTEKTRTEIVVFSFCLTRTYSNAVDSSAQQPT